MRPKTMNQPFLCVLFLLPIARPRSLFVVDGGFIRSGHEERRATRMPTAVTSLDQSSKGAGRFCPETLTNYFEDLNALLDDAGSVYSPVKTSSETSGGTGKVSSGEIEQGALTSFLFTSDFVDLNDDQVAYIQSLFEDGKFCEELDPTCKPGATKTIRDTSSELGETSSLVRSEFVFLEGLEQFDRELVFIDADKAVNGTCSLHTFPSVSDKWIGSPNFLNDPETAQEVAKGSPLTRAQNLYPSGDRVCIWPTGTGTFDVQVMHTVTSTIGGLLGPLFNKGLFDASQADAYLSEAQKLEDNVKALA